MERLKLLHFLRSGIRKSWQDARDLLLLAHSSFSRRIRKMAFLAGSSDGREFESVVGSEADDGAVEVTAKSNVADDDKDGDDEDAEAEDAEAGTPLTRSRTNSSRRA